MSVTDWPELPPSTPSVTAALLLLTVTGSAKVPEICCPLASRTSKSLTSWPLNAPPQFALGYVPITNDAGGLAFGAAVGVGDGVCVGNDVGEAVGLPVGVGAILGEALGEPTGVGGAPEGTGVGVAPGEPAGVGDALAVGEAPGDGLCVGNPPGVPVGAADGTTPPV